MAIGRYEIDMTKGSILKNMIAFAIPLMLTNILQLLYNAADQIVVGRWAGPHCLAAVGATGSFTVVLTNLFIGLSIGANVAVSKRYGAKDFDGLKRATHTAVLLGVLGGIASCILGQILCRPILELMGTPEDVINLSVLYMRIIFIGVPAQIVYNFGSAILRSVGDTKRPLYILSVTGIVNVVLNLILVIGFGMDVAGVAVATATAHYLSAAAILYSLVTSDTVYRVNLKKLKIHKDAVKDIISVGIPAGIQSSVFSLSNMVVQSSINSFGTATMAGRTAGASIESFVYTSMDSFHQATVTAVGQNYGGKHEKRIYKSIKTGIMCAVVAGGILGLLVFLLGRQLLGIYIIDNPEAIEQGMVYITVCGLPYFICGIMNVLSGALRGLGHSKVSALISVVCTCGFRILWIFTVVPLMRATWVLYMCWPLSWMLVSIFLLINFFAVRKKTMWKMYARQ